MLLKDDIAYDIEWTRNRETYAPAESAERWRRHRVALEQLLSEDFIYVSLTSFEAQALRGCEERWLELQGEALEPDLQASQAPLLPLHYVSLEHASQDQRISHSWRATLPCSAARLPALFAMLAEVNSSDRTWNATQRRCVEQVLARCTAQLLIASPPAAATVVEPTRAARQPLARG